MVCQTCAPPVEERVGIGLIHHHGRIHLAKARPWRNLGFRMIGHRAECRSSGLEPRRVAVQAGRPGNRSEGPGPPARTGPHTAVTQSVLAIAGMLTLIACAGILVVIVAAPLVLLLVARGGRIVP